MTRPRRGIGQYVEQWHGRAEAAVNLALQAVGISQECLDIARMLRHDPPVWLNLMTVYHRLKLGMEKSGELEIGMSSIQPFPGEWGCLGISWTYWKMIIGGLHFGVVTDRFLCFSGFSAPTLLQMLSSQSTLFAMSWSFCFGDCLTQV